MYSARNRNLHGRISTMFALGLYWRLASPALMVPTYLTLHIGVFAPAVVANLRREPWTVASLSARLVRLTSDLWFHRIWALKIIISALLFRPFLCHSIYLSQFTNSFSLLSILPWRSQMITLPQFSVAWLIPSALVKCLDMTNKSTVGMYFVHRRNVKTQQVPSRISWFTMLGDFDLNGPDQRDF